MRVYIDLISGDEFVSDAYPQAMLYEDSILECKGRYTKKGNDNIKIAADEEDEDAGEGETVVDIVDAFQLNEIQGMGKKDFMGWVKGYLPKVVKKLEETGKADRVADFKKGATDAAKFIASKWDEMQVFCGPKYDMEGAWCFAYQKEQEDEGPTFLFFHDGLKCMKV